MELLKFNVSAAGLSQENKTQTTVTFVVTVCTEINYLGNKNGHGWVQLGWTACNWGGEGV